MASVVAAFSAVADQAISAVQAQSDAAAQVREIPSSSMSR